MGRSPETDFACTAKTFCPCQGMLSQACRSLVLFWCAFRRGAWLVESQRSPLKRFFIKLLYGTPEGVS